MKKFIISLIGAVLLTSCGTGTYSLSSGKTDIGLLSFTSEYKTRLSVTVDKEECNIFSVKTSAWKKNRNIKQTAQNSLQLTPGQHNIIVKINGKEVYNKRIFISTQEHKIIEL